MLGSNARERITFSIYNRRESDMQQSYRTLECGMCWRTGETSNTCKRLLHCHTSQLFALDIHHDVA